MDCADAENTTAENTAAQDTAAGPDPAAVPPAIPTDPDVDLHVPAQRRELADHPVTLLAMIAVGGAAGACARYGAGLLWPTRPGEIGWTTLGVNTLGCAAIGVLMTLLAEGRLTHPLTRPLLGTGVLGGFTTFSTYTVDAQRLFDAGRAGTALASLGLTVLSALTAVWAAATVTRRLARRPAPPPTQATRATQASTPGTAPSGRPGVGAPPPAGGAGGRGRWRR